MSKIGDKKERFGKPYQFGVKGVSKRGQKFAVRAYCNGVQAYVGMASTLEEAAKMRESAERIIEKRNPR